jgi:hypothetical protein
MVVVVLLGVVVMVMVVCRVLVVVGRYIVVVVEVPGARYRVEIVDDAGEEGVWVRFVRLGLVGWEGGSVVGDGDGEGEGGWIWGE